MNSETELEIISNTADETVEIGRKIGQYLRGGEIIDLSSDVGGGKTVFVRGLAKGFGSTDQVASPTFTISRHYQSTHTDLAIHHFDFYRLDDPGLMKLELGESLSDPKTIVVVEWSGVVSDVLPQDRLLIKIGAIGEHTRALSLQAGKEHDHLLQGLR